MEHEEQLSGTSDVNQKKTCKSLSNCCCSATVSKSFGRNASQKFPKGWNASRMGALTPLHYYETTCVFARSFFTKTDVEILVLNATFILNTVSCLLILYF